MVLSGVLAIVPADGLVAQIRDDIGGRAPRPSAPSVPGPQAQDTSELARLRRENAALQLKRPDNAASYEEYTWALGITKWVLGVWLALVLYYIAWAIHRYVYNYGLSNREWKILSPEVYETPLDRLWVRFLNIRPMKWLTGGAESYERRRAALMNYRRVNRALDDAAAGDGDPVARPATPTQPFAEPEQNPYQSDSFGLPPGTIRGVLALTALVMFLMVEWVNLYAPASLEHQFDGLVTVFQMVIAFYFGSRAVEVIQAKTADAKRREEEEKEAAPGVRAPAAAIAAKDGESDATVPAISKSLPEGATEKVLLPEGSTEKRFANVVAMARNGRAAGPAPIALTNADPLPLRVLALTAAFETGRTFPGCFGTVAGNFDGQGISFGVLQWNIGQRSVQPLWKEMRDKHRPVLERILGPLTGEFIAMLDGTKEDQMQWALSIQHMASDRRNSWRIADTWRTALEALGRCDEMIKIQQVRADGEYQIALQFCRDFDLTTDRGVALMFDIRVQNGSVDRNGAGDRIRADYDLIDPALTPQEQEVARMKVIARRRSDVALVQWRKDVYERKLTIAEGKGTVHGRAFDLATDFAITL
jgi:hypothetical protein